MSLFGNILGGAGIGGAIAGGAGALTGGSLGALGALGGGVLGGLFGTDKGVTDTSGSTSPWAPLQPYLLQGYQGAQNLYNQGPYAGPFIGAQSPYTLQSQQMQAATAQDQNSLTAQSQQGLGATIRGDYLDPSSNPYLQNTVNQALGQASSTFAGQYGGNAGTNLSNSGYQEALARNLGNTALPYYMNNYNQERQNQLNAFGMAPQMDYAQSAALGNVGAQQDARSQAEVEAQQQQWQSPWTNLQAYQQALNSGLGFNQATGQTPYYQNNTATTLGALVGGAALLKGFK